MKKKYLTIILLLIMTIFWACGVKKVNHKNKTLDNKFEQTYPKLFLLSNGLTTDTLKSAFLNFLDKEPRVFSIAIVVNASTTEKKKQKKTNRVKVQFHEMGFDSSKIEQFDLLARNPSELSEFDIIYILGGNPFLLLHEVKKSGADKVLKKIAHQDKILMGYSAGSLLLGPNLALMDDVDSLLEFNEIDQKDLECLGLYDFHIFPHYADFTNQVPELIIKINQFESKSDLPVYRLNDNQGIIYQEGRIEFVGE